MEQRRFAQSQTPEMAKPGSWTHMLLDVVRRGDLPAELLPPAMRDYIVPSLDTTISATGELIYQLGRNPDQWALLRSKPELARNAANEATRMASPVRSFGRHISLDVEVAGVTIPEGARIMMMLAAANRDERAFERPNDFDFTRDPRLHLGFGRGIHMCAGMHLAQLEMMSLLKAMIPRVETIEVGAMRVNKALNYRLGITESPMRRAAMSWIGRGDFIDEGLVATLAARAQLRMPEAGNEIESAGSRVTDAINGVTRG